MVRKIIFRRFIPWAAVMAVAGGIFSLITVLSVMEGFKVEMRTRLRGTLSHLRAMNEGSSMLDQEQVQEIIEKQPHVMASAPYVECKALYQSDQLIPCQLIGVDPIAQSKVTQFASYMLHDDEIALLEKRQEAFLPAIAQGKRDAAPFTEPELKHLFSRQRRKEIFAAKIPLTQRQLHKRLPQPIIAGVGFLEYHGVHLGDIVSLLTFSPKSNNTCSQDFLVVGFCKSGIQEHDAGVMYTGFRAAQKYLQLYDERQEQFRYTGISIRLDDYRHAQEIQSALGNSIYAHSAGRFGFGLRTWEDERKNLLQAVEVEKTIISSMMMLIVAFAGAMIFLILSLIVIEKTKDLGVLRSIGARPLAVVGLFMRLGLLLVAIGIAVGGTAGYYFVTNINFIHAKITEQTGFSLFPPDIYYLTEIPVSINVTDICLVLGSAILFGFLGSLVPAIWAANRDPIRALRHE